MKKKMNILCDFIVVMALILGCSGGGGSGSGGPDNLDGDDNRETVEMSGVWNGTVEMNLNGEEDQKLELVQTGNNLSGSFEGPGGQSDNVNGTIDESGVTLTILFGQGDDIMKFHYEGSLQNGVYSGEFTLLVNDEIQDEGTFSFKKDGDAPAPQPQGIDMSGSWEGTMSTQRFGNSQLAFELEQDGSNISGDMTFDGYHTSNVTGSVNQSTVAISGIYPTETDAMLEFAFKGTINGNTYSGTLTVFIGGEIDEQACTFTVSTDGDEPAPQPPAPQPQDVDMSGSWEGTMSTQRFGNSQLAFELEQNGSNISGDMTFDGYHTSNVNGSVNQSTATISGIYPTETDAMLEFAFEGTVNGNTYSGTLTVLIGGEIDEQGLAFSVSKDGDMPPNPDPIIHEVEASSCFELETGEETPSPCGDTSDIFFWGVDPFSDGDIFCVQEGNYPTLESVPSDYSQCDWVDYIEGGLGLQNLGVIVRDLSYQHHYKMRIIENQAPTITFEYENID